VFGGLLAAQALVAASEDRRLAPRSISTRFVRRAAGDRPVEHDVTTVAESTTFADRRITVTQDGVLVAEVGVLAHVPDDTDLEHDEGLDDPPPPPDDDAAVQRGAGFDVIDLNDPPAHHPAAAAPRQRHWMRAPGTPLDDPVTNDAMLVMASDLLLVAAAWRPVDGRSIVDPEVVAYGLTFTVWFHRPARLDRWHLLEARCPVAAGGRSLTFGSWYDLDRRLVASVALDAVMRLRARR
jgi:acyl-CoA thioesterase-2